ncbi:MAG TPA: class I SAM-dependent methyltransferase [Acidimicrobiales bacterium]
MRIDRGAAWRAFATYRGAPVATRAFVAARLVVAPLAPLTEEARRLRGRVLSLGSGISIVERYLAEVNPDLHIEGVDLDPRHIELIDATRERSPRVTLRQGDATRIDEPDESYDAVLVCDALHHFDPERHKPLAGAIAACLRPGGVVVVKDLDVAPRWKYHWNRLHDRIVAGPEPIHCRSPEEMAEVLAGAGLLPERVERTDRPWTPYAHYVVRARKP